MLNSVNGFSVGVPFNINDKVIINQAIFLERTEIFGNIQQRTGVIIGMHTDGRYIVLFANPHGNMPSRVIDYFDENELNLYIFEYHNPIMRNLRRFCAGVVN